MAKAKKTKKVKKTKAPPKAKKVAGKAKTKKAPAKKVTKKTTAKKATKKAPAKKVAKKVTKAKKAGTKKTASKKVAPKAPRIKKPAALSSSPSPVADQELLGHEAPALFLPNQNGESVDLSSVIESHAKVVLYFYPKDDTPGCTKEACDFRDNLNRIEASGIKILGVSPDDPASHRKFIEKYNLNFELLSDVEHQLAEALQVWKEKSFMGKTYMGVERSTFLFHEGRIVKVWQPVKVEGHVDDVLASIAGL